MTVDLAVSLLNRAANGAELLEILDTIAANDSSESIIPTLQEVQF